MSMNRRLLLGLGLAAGLTIPSAAMAEDTIKIGVLATFEGAFAILGDDSMFGVTTPCVQAVTRRLEADYDCLVFHATGTGGRAMVNDARVTSEKATIGEADVTAEGVVKLSLGKKRHVVLRPA